jgi:drug/metabolite transporter superfamily protein YnfA
VNAAASILALFCLFLIIAPNVHTGVVMTVGLALIVVGCVAQLDDESNLLRAFELVIYGNAVVAASLVWHYVIKPRLPSIHTFKPHLPFERRREPR